MAHSWHGVGTVSLLFLATQPIELTVGGGLGCPEGASGDDNADGGA
jgi:hypothetical protein